MLVHVCNINHNGYFILYYKARSHALRGHVRYDAHASKSVIICIACTEPARGGRASRAYIPTQSVGTRKAQSVGTRNGTTLSRY